MTPIRLFFLVVLITAFTDIAGINQGADSSAVIEKVYLHTDRSYYFPGDDIWFKAYLVDAYDRSFSGISMNLHVELISPDREITAARTIRLDGGLGYGDIRLPEEITSGRYRLRAYTNYMRNFNDSLFFNKEITVVTSSPAGKDTEATGTGSGTPDITFLPEGGSLVEEVTSVVAFKAVDGRGRGCDVEGEIYSSSGELVTSFRSSHLGMGSFIMKPLPGKAYYAVVRSPGRKETTKELPAIFPEGVTLSCQENSDFSSLPVIIRTNDRTLPLIRDRELTLTISVRGEVIRTLSLKINAPVNTLDLPADDLPEGIIMLTLSTDEELPLAERLVFIHHGNDIKIGIDTDSDEYGQRDPVSLRISVPAETGNDQIAYLSLSAAESIYTDNMEEYPSTITSWFFLESDVHGTVEAPSWYFDPSNPGRKEKLDLLLMTQGWRDFAWKYDPPEAFQPETGFSISGRVRKTFSDKPPDKASVNIMVIQGDKMMTEVMQTDAEGRFAVNNIDITGVANLTVSAFNHRNNPDGIVIMDSTTYSPPEISGYTTVPGVKVPEEDSSPATEVAEKEEEKEMEMEMEKETDKETVMARDYEMMETIRKRYRLFDTIDLGDVTIKADAPVSRQEARVQSVRLMYGKPDHEVIVTKAMESLPAAPELLMGTAPRVRVTQKDIAEYTIRVGMGIILNRDPLLVIDGIPVDIKYLNFMPIYLIDRIDVLTSPAKTAVFGMGGGDGVISVITRTEERRDREHQPVRHSVNSVITGFDYPRVFYSPSHDPSIPSDYEHDIRKTLLWEPDIVIPAGQDLLLDYYNADNSTTIRIMVEGITSSGVPVTATSEYHVID